MYEVRNIHGTSKLRNSQALSTFKRCQSRNQSCKSSDIHAKIHGWEHRIYRLYFSGNCEEISTIAINKCVTHIFIFLHLLKATQRNKIMRIRRNREPVEIQETKKKFRNQEASQITGIEKNHLFHELEKNQ